MLFVPINPTLWAFPTWYLFLWCLTRSLLLCPFSHPIVVLKFRLCCYWCRGKFCRDIHSALFEEPDLHFIYEDLRPKSFAVLLINDKTPKNPVNAVLLSVCRPDNIDYTKALGRICLFDLTYHDFRHFLGKIDQSKHALPCLSALNNVVAKQPQQRKRRNSRNTAAWLLDMELS